MFSLKNLIKVAVTGSMTMVLTACYGIVAPMSRVISTRKKSGEPIPGLKISYKAELDSQKNPYTSLGYTDEYGDLVYETIYDIQGGEVTSLKIEDIDGDKNGGDFETKIVTPDYGSSIIDVEMEEKSL